MSCKLHLDEIDLAHEKPNNASEYEDQNVKEDEAKQVESSNSKVVNLLPLEVVTLYVTCRGTLIIHSSWLFGIYEIYQSINQLINHKSTSDQN